VERFPFRVQFEQKSDHVLMTIDNQTGKDLTDCYLVVAGRRYALGTIGRGAHWAKEFPLALQAPQEEGALRSTPAAALRDISFNDKTRDILFHSSLFSTPDGAVTSTGDVAIFFGWVKDSEPRVWVDHAGMWAYDYTLFRTVLPLDTGEDA
jgi:hypothetical protein